MFLGCKPYKYEKETNTFRTYLTDNFSKDIEVKKHYYLLNNSYVCGSCMSSFLTIMDTSINTNNKNITLITTLKFNINKSLSNKIKLLKDNEGQLNYENLNLNNLTLFYTERKRIVKISYFLVGDENKFRMELNKILDIIE